MTDSKSPLSLAMELMKLRVIVLLQITAICSILIHDALVRNEVIEGSRTWVDTLIAIGLTVIGGTLSAGGSNAINMWYDADIDPHMKRTMNRPIPRGDVKARTALMFGVSISLIGSSLFFFAHWKAAFWSFFSVFFYVFIYSIWLKRRTPQNIVIGGIAGSTPPLIGWIVASSATIPANYNPFDLGSPIPWILFLLIFLWTPPHFWALALYRSGEYGKVNIPMMNEVKGPESTIKQSKFYVLLLFLLGALPCFWPNSGIPLLWAFISGGLTLWYALSVWQIDIHEPLDQNGRMPKAVKSFFRSLFYLGWMFISIVVVSFIPPEWLGPFGIL